MNSEYLYRCSICKKQINVYLSLQRIIMLYKVIFIYRGCGLIVVGDVASISEVLETKCMSTYSIQHYNDYW